MAEGHNDISDAVVNLKQPTKEYPTSYIYEVTIVVYMGSDHIAATEKGELFQSTLDGALDAVERQVHEFRKQQRNYETTPIAHFNVVKYAEVDKA